MTATSYQQGLFHRRCPICRCRWVDRSGRTPCPLRQYRHNVDKGKAAAKKKSAPKKPPATTTQLTLTLTPPTSGPPTGHGEEGERDA